MSVWLIDVNHVAVGDSWLAAGHVDSEAVDWILKKRSSGWLAELAI